MEGGIEWWASGWDRVMSSCGWCLIVFGDSELAQNVECRVVLGGGRWVAVCSWCLALSGVEGEIQKGLQKGGEP